MAPQNKIRIPYQSADVQKIVDEVVEQSGVEGLKEKVIDKVKIAMQITSGNLPERVQTWVYKICLVHTGGIELGEFTGKLAEPIDLASLPNSSYCGKQREAINI
ncbi:MAG: hypothetical protein PHQ95_02105 [Candidatus Gracilibacteria bacterium]|nr:hypothetical protein [Candidatus Gracilibacteria bacterium]